MSASVTSGAFGLWATIYKWKKLVVIHWNQLKFTKWIEWFLTRYAFPMRFSDIGKKMSPSRSRGIPEVMQRYDFLIHLCAKASVSLRCVSRFLHKKKHNYYLSHISRVNITLKSGVHQWLPCQDGVLAGRFPPRNLDPDEVCEPIVEGGCPRWNIGLYHLSKYWQMGLRLINQNRLS